MAAFSRGFKFLSIRNDSLCTRCLQFSTSSAVQSGHNRWSKIKHDKGAVDAKKTKARSIFSKEIALASKLYGADPNLNPKLAAVLVNAKKAGFPKASMDAAIARGQGKSTTGASLESTTLEVILSSKVAMIIEAETENKARTQQDLRQLVKYYGGNVTPTTFLFEKKGKLVFPKVEPASLNSFMDEAILAGAEDVDDDENGNTLVWTEPNKTMSTVKAISGSLGLDVISSDILWIPNRDTKVPLEKKEDASRLQEFLDKVRDVSEVQGVYANVAQGVLNDDPWEDMQEKLDTFVTT